MKVNWMVPVRGLLALVKRLAGMVWSLVELAVSIPLVPLFYLLVLMGTGFQVICKKVRRIFVIADFVLIDPAIDEYGHVWATVEGKTGTDGLIAGKFRNLKLVSQGFVMEIETERGTYLAPYLDPGQDYKVVAKIIADTLLTHDMTRIKPTDT